MSAGLAASTVTPGRTAPELSRTTPVIDAWAEAAAGASAMTAKTRSRAMNVFMEPRMLDERRAEGPERLAMKPGGIADRLLNSHDFGWFRRGRIIPRSEDRPPWEIPCPPPTGRRAMRSAPSGLTLNRYS